MKGKDYYGIGDDEYSRYKTIDNGKTWSTDGESGGPGEKVYDRIIYGSTNNGGLTYSDDGGTTIHKSDRTEGNWGNIVYTTAKETTEANHGFIVYASSFDKDLIVYTEDLGETWKDIAGAASGSEAKVINGVAYIYGDGPVTKIENGVATVIAENAVFVDGNIQAQDIAEEPKIEGVLKVVLNQLFLPILTKRFAGMKYEDFCNMIPDLNLGNLSYEKAIFGANNTLQKDEIDYEYYCNMSPFNYSLSDIIGTTTGDNTQLVLYSTIDDMLIKNPILKKYFDIIDNMLEIKCNMTKTAALGDIFQAGANTIDFGELSDIQQTAEEYSNAVQYAKILTNTYRTAVASMVGTIINKIYTTDNFRKMVILKAAIFETLKEQAGVISYKLNEIKKKVAMDTFYVSEQDFDGVNFKFGDGLEKAIDNYIKAISNLITFDNIGGENGKQYEIIKAADLYKDQKGDWIAYIRSKLTPPVVTYEKINPYVEDLEEFKKKFNEIPSDYNKNKNLCLLAYGAIVTDNDADGEAKKTYDSYKGEEFYNFCESIENPKEDIQATTQRVTEYSNNTTEADTIAIQKKQREFANGYVFKYRVDKNVIKDFCKSIEEQLKKQIEEVLKGLTPENKVNLYLTEEAMLADENIETADGISSKNIFNNYTLMLNKFKERCIELLTYTVDNFLKNSDTNDITLDDEYNAELIEKQDKAIDTFVANYGSTAIVDEMTSYMRSKGNTLMTILFNSYKNSMEAI